MKSLIVLAVAIASCSSLAFAKDASSHSAFCAAQDIAPLESRVKHSIKEWGAQGDGVTDDTAALQKAFDSVGSGEILVLPAGQYRFKKSLTLGRDDVVLTGDKAVLVAQTPGDEALFLKGNGSAIIGVTFNGAGVTRLGSKESAQIVVTGNNNQVIDNEVYGSASAGIFVYGAHHYRIIGNRVHDTLADGIHQTNGASDGIVKGNKVWKTGDDMIAVVSYRNKNDASDVKSLDKNILIEGNEVSGNTGGRGITVVGGENIIIQNNAVSDVWCCAGILVAQESSYHTFGTHHVLIRHNTVNRIELSPAPPGKKYTQHAAIDMNSSGEMPVEDIRIEDNTITGSRFSGVRVLGDICNVKISANSLSAIQGKPLEITNTPCRTTLACKGNSIDGKELQTESFCPILRAMALLK